MTGLGYNVLEVVDWFYFKNRAMGGEKCVAEVILHHQDSGYSVNIYAFDVIQFVEFKGFPSLGRAMARAKYIAQQGFFPIPKWWYE